MEFIMASSLQEQVMTVLIEEIRRTLREGKSVNIPELGTFSVLHVPSRIETTDDGSQMISPPRDSITFTPES